MSKSICQLSAILVLIASASVSGCVSKAPRPVTELVLADTALESAENAGAREYAPIEFRVAREKKDAADEAIANKQYAIARRLVLEARVDAELAKAASDAEKSRLALYEAQDTITLIHLKVTSAGDDQ